MMDHCDKHGSYATLCRECDYETIGRHEEAMTSQPTSELDEIEARLRDRRCTAFDRDWGACGRCENCLIVQAADTIRQLREQLGEAKVALEANERQLMICALDYFRDHRLGYQDDAAKQEVDVLIAKITALGE